MEEGRRIQLKNKIYQKAAYAPPFDLLARLLLIRYICSVFAGSAFEVCLSVFDSLIKPQKTTARLFTLRSTHMIA